MSTHTTPWPAGTPCWLDLSTPDVAGAAAFYSSFLPWSVSEPDPRYGGYAVAQQGAAAVAGIAPARAGAPIAWTLYFASDDADATTAAIVAHGGTVVMGPADIGGQGRMCFAADPSGAQFGVWQAGEHIGSGVVNEPGGLDWEDLRSSDPAAARTFYGAVFGWEFQPLPGGGPDYMTFSPAGSDRPMGGLGGMMGQDGLASHWIVYFGVADAAAAVAAAERAGGAVIASDFETPYGRMAGLVDPDGAVFWLHQAGATD